jgi:formylglycine-generating enzyme required for sulfatase activity
MLAGFLLSGLMAVMAVDFDTLKTDHAQSVKKAETEYTEWAQKSQALYSDALRTMETQLKNAGHLEGLLAVRKEFERLEATKEIPIPGADTPKPIAQEQTAHQRRIEVVAAKRTQALIAASKEYLVQLNALKRELTANDKIPAALQVQEEIKQQNQLLAALLAGTASVGTRSPAKMTIQLADGMKLELLHCPAGTFMMGSPANEAGRGDKETQHQVTISKPFWLGKTEVTQGQWQAVMGANPSNFKGADLPVECVSWDDAVSFCKKLTDRAKATGTLPAGYEYRLPTEAEWEYACRAGSSTRFSSGDGLKKLQEAGWYAENSGNQSYPDDEWLADFGKEDKTDLFTKLTDRKLTSHPVGGKQANAWGLYDMHGNVFEWCQDWYVDYPAGTATDPTGPVTGATRVTRGGSWDIIAGLCRAAFRYGNVPGFRYFNLGFRVALAPVIK